MTFFPAMGTPNGVGGDNSMVSTLIMFGSIFLIFYFMIIRPQQKKAKEREAMLKLMKKGDKVLTHSGMYGTIVSIEDKQVVLNVASNVNIRFDLAAIGSVVAPKEGE